MKTLFTILILCSSFLSYAQDSLQLPPSTAAIGMMMENVGTILRKEEKEIYQFNDRVGLRVQRIWISGLYLFDAGSDKRLNGVRFATTYTDRNSDSRLYESFMDSEEILLLMKYIDMLSMMAGKEEENSAGYILNSKDLRFYADFTRYSKTRTKWSYGIYLRKNFYRTEMPLQLKDLLGLRVQLSNYLREIAVK